MSSGKRPSSSSSSTSSSAAKRGRKAKPPASSQKKTTSASQAKKTRKSVRKAQSVLSEDDAKDPGDDSPDEVDLTLSGGANPPPVQPQVPNSMVPEDESEDDFEEDDDNCPEEEESESGSDGGDSDCAAADLEWKFDGVLPEVKIDWECDGEPRVPIMQGATALHCFERVFSKAALTLIVTETNRHARTLYARKRKDIKDWKDVTESELLKFFGHLMVSHLHARAHMHAYVLRPHPSSTITYTTHSCQGSDGLFRR